MVPPSLILSQSNLISPRWSCKCWIRHHEGSLQKFEIATYAASSIHLAKFSLIKCLRSASQLGCNLYRFLCNNGVFNSYECETNHFFLNMETGYGTVVTIDPLWRWCDDLVELIKLTYCLLESFWTDYGATGIWIQGHVSAKSLCNSL